MQFLDYICYAVCIFGCLIHLVVSIVHSFLQNKKIDNLCKICGLPESLHSGLDHEFTSSEIEFFKSDLSSIENALSMFTQTDVSSANPYYRVCLARKAALEHLLEVIDHDS